MSSRGYAVRKGYESIPRDLLQPRPNTMSARSLGILTHLLSQPDGWNSSAERLARTFKEGRVAIEAALRELEDLGYLARRRVRLERGRIGWLWLYGDDPERVAGEMNARLEQHAAEQGYATVSRFPGTGQPSLGGPSLDSWGS